MMNVKNKIEKEEKWGRNDDKEAVSDLLDSGYAFVFHSLSKVTSYFPSLHKLPLIIFKPINHK